MALTQRGAPTQHLARIGLLARAPRAKADHYECAGLHSALREPGRCRLANRRARLETRIGCDRRRRDAEGPQQREQAFPLVPGGGRRQGVGEAAQAPVGVGDGALCPDEKGAPRRSLRCLAVGRNGDIVAPQAQAQPQERLPEGGAGADAASHPCTPVCPDAVDVGEAGEHPRVVIRGEHVDARVRQRRAQHLNHRGSEQQVAHLIPLHDEDFHRGQRKGDFRR